jgi:hypothetical protein
MLPTVPSDPCLKLLNKPKETWLFGTCYAKSTVDAAGTGNREQGTDFNFLIF